MKITLSPGKIARWLIYTTLCLGMLSFIGQYAKYEMGRGSLWGFVRLTNVNSESNIPTWFSSSLLLLASITLYAIASAKRTDGDRFAGRWKLLSIVFLFLSIDEAACIHEEVGLFLQAKFQTTGFLTYAWVIPWSILVLVLAVAYIRFLAALPSRTRSLAFISAIMYIGGAIGIEMLTSKVSEIYGEASYTTAILSHFEETLEMLGVITFIYTLMSYMTTQMKQAHIHIGDRYTSLDMSGLDAVPLSTAHQQADPEG